MSGRVDAVADRRTGDVAAQILSGLREEPHRRVPDEFAPTGGR